MMHYEDLVLPSGKILSSQGTIVSSLDATVGETVNVYLQDGRRAVAEVIGFDESTSQLMLFESNVQLHRNDLVVGTRQSMQIPVGDQLLGRVIDSTGLPIDGKAPLNDGERIGLQLETPDPLHRTPITKPFTTGIRAIDGLITVGCGQRVGLFAGSGVGKSTLLGDIARQSSADINVVALIGERGREVRPFLEEVLGEEGLARSIVVVSTSDQTPLARVRASETAVMIASWFRKQGNNVLFILDSLTRLATAQRELGLFLGEPPTSRGFTPSVFQKMAVLLEQLGNSDVGSITGLLTVLVDGDDMNEPVTDSARSILDGHIVLDRRLAHKAHFPAIDVLGSISRLFTEIASPRHQAAARTIRRILASYQEVEDLIQIGAYRPGAVPGTDAAVSMVPHVNEFLQQNLKSPDSMAQTVQSMLRLAADYENALPQGVTS